MEYLNYLNHAPIAFHFAKNPRYFIVEEIPLYEFCGSGEHLILKVRKKGVSTNEMLNIFSRNLGIKRTEIGYAGLKDKNALTIQYISIHKKFAKQIENFNAENIKILSATYHKNKLKLGHLRGNKFYICVKKVDKINAIKIEEICKILVQNGMPNYFGMQRFGKNGDNFTQGRAILEKNKILDKREILDKRTNLQGQFKVRDKKTAQFLISAYQSHLFNEWLKKRVEFCKVLESFGVKVASTRYKIAIDEIKELQNQAHFFKILRGDIMSEYPFGRLKSADERSAEQFLSHQIAPTGLLQGKKMMRATQSAGIFESEFYDSLLENQIGDRRVAWVFLQDLEFIYKKETAQGEFRFTLPKGSYATIFLEILSNNPKILSESSSKAKQNADDLKASDLLDF